MKHKTKKVSCPDCKKKEPNRIIFVKSGIAHLRCPECDSVNPYAVGAAKPKAKPVAVVVPAEAAPVEEAPVEEVPGVEIPAEEAPAEEAPAAQSVDGQSPAVETAEEPKAATEESGNTDADTPESELPEPKDTEDAKDSKVKEVLAQVAEAQRVDQGNDEESGRISTMIDHAGVMEKCKKKCPPYAASNDYFAGDCFHHKIFGDGYVLAVLPSQKMTVLFSEQKRLLRCGPNSQKEAIIQFGEKSALS